MSTQDDLARLPRIFDQITSEGQVPALRDRSGVYEFDISDGGGKWFLNLDHGTPHLADSTEHPDVIVECSPSDFVGLTHGDQNLMTAFLQGRVVCSGDLGFALDFRRLLPVPA